LSVKEGDIRVSRPDNQEGRLKVRVFLEKNLDGKDTKHKIYDFT
jgi:hypothetical protein